MKILLVQPKMNKRPMDTDLKTRMAPSLALLTLAGLTPAPHTVEIANENIGEIDFDYGADLVAVTVTVDVMPRAAGIAREFQKRGVPVVAGGIHITCCPDEAAPFFDAICVGPAERVWQRMLDDAARGSLQKTYRDTDGFLSGELASPAYGAVHSEPYLYTNIIATSRGCPNRCAFCYNSSPNRAHIVRPVDDIMRDIAALGTRHILFIDDNFIGDPARAEALLLRMRGMRLTWGAAVTTRVLDHPRLLDLMAETGCKSLFIGLESVNNDSLRDVGKDNAFEKYDAIAEAVHSRGIMLNASMVFGLDADGPDVFDKTLDWLVTRKIETLTSHILTPYPGTALHRRMEADGRITSRDLSLYNTAHVVFRPARMTPEQLRDGYLRMYRRFYSFGNIIRRLPRHRRQWIPYLLFNLFYRKFGRFTSLLARIVPMRVLGRHAARISYRVR